MASSKTLVSHTVKVYSIQDFAQKYLTKDQIRKLGERFDRKHTWGDTDMVCISPETLIEDLLAEELPVPRWLRQCEVDTMFELYGTSDFWEGE